MDIRQRLLNAVGSTNSNNPRRYDQLDNSNSVELGPSSFGERQRNLSGSSSSGTAFLGAGSGTDDTIPLYNNRPQTRHTRSDDLGSSDIDNGVHNDGFGRPPYTFNRRYHPTNNNTASAMTMDLMNQASAYLYYNAQVAGTRLARVNVDPFYVKFLWVFSLIAIFFLSSIAHMLKSDSIYIKTPASAASKPELGNAVIWAIVLYSLIFISCSYSIWKQVKLRRRYAIQREFYYGSVSTNDALL